MKQVETPRFLDQSIGGHFKGRNPTVTVAELQRAWVDAAIVFYIGKAGGTNSEATLRSRLRQYMQFGKRKTVWALGWAIHLAASRVK